MYRKPHVNQLAFEDFGLPFGGKLRSDNRWVILAKQIPWAEVDTAYAQQFSQDDIGSPAKSSRLALGALILKERLGVTDRELVAQIAENPYLQYFLGLLTYQEEAPFHHSLLTTFRKRFPTDSLETINEAIARLIADAQPPEGEPGEEEGEGEADFPKGQLLVDATCVPADIKYPTDLHLLNDAREKTEELIDHMHAARATVQKKPRTYRQNARQDYLRVAKSKKPKSQKLRRGIGPTAPVSPAQSRSHCRHGPRRAARFLTCHALPSAARHSRTVSATALDVHAPLSSDRRSTGQP
jgi:hypothetical protein